MSNKEKYDQVFVESLEVEESQLLGLKYQDVPNWDSVGHMGLINEIEEAFDIQMETDDIINFNSYAKGMEILVKYGISFE